MWLFFALAFSLLPGVPAFLAPARAGASPVWPPSALPAEALPKRAVTGAAWSATEAEGTGSHASSAATLLLGASVLFALSRRVSNASSARIPRKVWESMPFKYADENKYALKAATAGWKDWVALRKDTRLTMGRKIRYMKQQKILRQHNIGWGRHGAWHYHSENSKNRKMYEGPEDHPDNPNFPRPGVQMPALGFGESGAVNLSCSIASPVRSGASWGNSSVKRAVYGRQPVRSAMVRHAHKKAAASSKNHSVRRNSKFWGNFALNGKAVKQGAILAKQKGCNWYAGKNVKMGRNHCLVALKDGVVQWKGIRKHKEVTVIPWEYVRAKCRWMNTGTIAPVNYEPWMGKANDETKRLKAEWLETEEGKAWAEKKAKKKAVQKEIEKKIRAHIASRSKKEGVKDKVKAGDSDSEK